jgi:hypothetical protein
LERKRLSLEKKLMFQSMPGLNGLAEKLCTGQESSTSGAKALIVEIRYGPAKAVP